MTATRVTPGLGTRVLHSTEARRRQAHWQRASRRAHFPPGSRPTMAREAGQVCARPAVPRVGKGSVFFACVSVVTARRRAIARRAALQSPTPWLAPLPPPATTEVSFQDNQCLCQVGGWVGHRQAPGAGVVFPGLPFFPVRTGWRSLELAVESSSPISGMREETGGLLCCWCLCAPTWPPQLPRAPRVGPGWLWVVPAALSGGWFLDYQGLLCTTSLSALLRSLRAWCYHGYCPHFTDGETEAPRGETKARKTQGRHWNLNLCSRS